MRPASPALPRLTTWSRTLSGVSCAWPWAHQMPGICATPRPHPAPPWPVWIRGGMPPGPPFPCPGSAHRLLSACLFQVQLCVRHMLPLGKDLLHWIPAVLQAGVCVPQATARVKSCRLATKSLGLCPGAAAAGGCPWLTVAEVGVGPGRPCCRLPCAPPVEFPFPARHPEPQHPLPKQLGAPLL